MWIKRGSLILYARFSGVLVRMPDLGLIEVLIGTLDRDH